MPLFILRRSDEPLAFAALWECWRGPKDAPLAQPLFTATIVTVGANGPISALHDRMPAILDGAARAAWLDPATPAAEAVSWLRPAADDLLRLIPISPRVNGVKNDDAACIAPLVEQRSLL